MKLESAGEGEPRSVTRSVRVQSNVDQSCGIAAGIFVTALHNVGLAALPLTPSNTKDRIRTLLRRPAGESVYMVMPVGYPADDALVAFRDNPVLGSSGGTDISFS